MPTGGDDATANLERARALIELRRFDDACTIAARLIATDPQDATLHALFAQCRLGLGDTPGTLEAAGRALACDPHCEHALRLAAIASMRSGSPASAVAYAERAVQETPEGVAALVTLCDSLRSAKRVPDAAQVARRAANVAPEDPRVHVALALVALDARDPAAGERHAREALAQDPTDVRALDALGVSLARQGRRDEALHYFRTVASERPDDDRIRRNAALVSRALPVEWRFAIMVAVLIGVPVLAVLGQPTWTMVPLWGVAALGAWRALTTLMTRNATSGDPKATRKQRRAIQRQTKAEARSLHPVRKSLFAVLLVVATPMTLIVAIVVGDQTSWVLGVAIFAVYGMFVGWFIRRPASGWAERRG